MAKRRRQFSAVVMVVNRVQVCRYISCTSSKERGQAAPEPPRCTAGKRGRCRLRALGKRRTGSSVGNLAIQPLLATYMCISHLFCPSGSCEHPWNNGCGDTTHAAVLLVTSRPASPSAPSFVTLSALTQGPDGHLQLVNNWVVARDGTHRQQRYWPLSAMTAPFRHIKLRS